MKFQDSSFNGLKVTVGTKSVTHARTHPRTHPRSSKSNMPHQLFQSWGHNNSNSIGPYIFIGSTCLVHIYVFAKFYEITSMILHDIKETKRYGHTVGRLFVCLVGRTDMKTVYPPTNTVCGEYNYSDLLLVAVYDLQHLGIIFLKSD